MSYCEPVISGLYDIIVKWLRTQVSCACIDILMRTDAQIDAGLCADIAMKLKHCTVLCTVSFAIAALDDFISALFWQHVAEFLSWWWVL